MASNIVKMRIEISNYEDVQTLFDMMDNLRRCRDDVHALENPADMVYECIDECLAGLEHIANNLTGKTEGVDLPDGIAP